MCRCLQGSSLVTGSSMRLMGRVSDRSIQEAPILAAERSRISVPIGGESLTPTLPEGSPHSQVRWTNRRNQAVNCLAVVRTVTKQGGAPRMGSRHPLAVGTDGNPRRLAGRVVSATSYSTAIRPVAFSLDSSARPLRPRLPMCGARPVTPSAICCGLPPRPIP